MHIHFTKSNIQHPPPSPPIWPQGPKTVTACKPFFSVTSRRLLVISTSWIRSFKLVCWDQNMLIFLNESTLFVLLVQKERERNVFVAWYEHQIRYAWVRCQKLASRLIRPTVNFIQQQKLRLMYKINHDMHKQLALKIDVGSCTSQSAVHGKNICSHLKTKTWNKWLVRYSGVLRVAEMQADAKRLARYMDVAKFTDRNG
jgi:hypothetical protein